MSRPEAFSELLIPVRRCREIAGRFTWPDGAWLGSGRQADALPLQQLQRALKAVGVKRARVVLDAGTDAVCRVHRTSAITQPEGYRLSIRSDGIEILARTDAGAFYAIQTLRDLLAIHGRNLPQCRIDDWPDFPRRGIYHDCARGKVPTVQTIKGLIERLARWKINELQLYVENGFRFKNHPDIGRGFDGFSPADIHEIQTHCRKHHIRFVGSLASLGHMELILKEPAYQHLGEMPGGGGYPGGTTLCPTDPGSIRLLRELYGEYLPLFEATDFNACGDEPWELGKGRSKAAAKRAGEGRLYMDFMKKVHRICADHGKRMNLWADIVLNHPRLLGDLPDDIVILNWAYEAEHKRIDQTNLLAEAGLPFMVCPGTNAWCSHGSRLSVAIENVRRFTQVGRRYGAQGVLHTDWGDGGHRNTLAVSLLSFAHAAAHSWHGRAVDDAGFAARFCRIQFGQTDSRMADSITKLGQIELTCGMPCYLGLYRSLRIPIVTPRRKRLWRVDQGRRDNEHFAEHDPQRLAEAIALARSLMQPKAWPKLRRHAEPFDQLSREEYMLAARQDYVTGWRSRLAWRYQQDEPIKPGEWRQMDEALAELGRRFDKLWLARNRQSRLGENQYILRHARRECQRLAR
jgi:hypothetical protein